MAKRDWTKAIEDALDAVGDRIRDWLDALEDLLAPQPELAPVPIPARPEDDRRRR